MYSPASKRNRFPRTIGFIRDFENAYDDVSDDVIIMEILHGKVQKRNFFGLNLLYEGKEISKTNHSDRKSFELSEYLPEVPFWWLLHKIRRVWSLRFYIYENIELTKTGGLFVRKLIKVETWTKRHRKDNRFLLAIGYIKYRLRWCQWWRHNHRNSARKCTKVKRNFSGSIFLMKEKIYRKSEAP